MSTLDCITDGNLRAFLLGELPERVARSVSNHLETCSECEAAARLLDGLTDPVIDRLRQEFQPRLAIGLTPARIEREPVAPARSASLAPPPRVEGFEIIEEVGRGGASIAIGAGTAYRAWVTRDDHPAVCVGSRPDTSTHGHFPPNPARSISGQTAPHLMSSPDLTCWSVIRGAARGDPGARDDFARRYEPVVRAYLAARWRSSDHVRALDDAVQEVFVECFQRGGALDRLEPDRPGGFRAFFYGVVRIVALRAESARGRGKEQLPPDGYDPRLVPADDTRLSRAFDRAWARALMAEAAARHAEDAERAGEAAVGRVELLRLRFHDGLPVREIARRRGCDPDAVHREYARARQEFRAALAAVVAFHHPGTPAEVERTCTELLDLLK